MMTARLDELAAGEGGKRWWKRERADEQEILLLPSSLPPLSRLSLTKPAGRAEIGSFGLIWGW
jgi:hypothetical protein